MAQAKAESKAASKAKKGDTPLLEWIAAGIGLLLTLGVIGVIGREALNGETSQLPAIQVAMTRVAPAASGYVVAFEARNRTGGTAAAVEIEAVLKRGGRIVETGMAVIDYVPGHGKAEGGIFFARDPRGHELELRALGFQTP